MSMWEDVLKTVAPFIGTAVGGPIGGIATKALMDGLLGEDATEEKLQKVIANATPEQLATIKKIEADFKVTMEELGVDIFALEVEDKKSARAMFSVNMWPQIGLTIVFISGFFIIFAVLIVFSEHMANIPGWLQGQIGTIIGVLTGGVVTILAFWYGSTKGSQDKDRKIGN